MKQDEASGHRILSVAAGSAAARAGVLPGDRLIAMQGEEVIDEIDYQFFSSSKRVSLTFLRGEEELTLDIAKQDWEPLGLSFAHPLTGSTRTCANRCVFCFVDQMPPRMRESLYVKDDDWRLSLRSGHYITLTNVGDREFARILSRGASPLYISVHATDPQARCRLLGHPEAGNLMRRLTALRDAGLKFHAQIVTCPGYNDGEVLDQTLGDLCSLYPAAQSVAVVPVGLTRYRESLPTIEPYTRDTAKSLLAQVERWQTRCLASLGTRFAFAADELYCLAGAPLPPDDAYEHYPQIENGVGMLRQLEREYVFAWEEMPPVVPRRVLLACGVSPAPFLRKMLAEYPVPGVEVTVLPVINRFFGDTVTVSGLLTGGDLLNALRGADTDQVLLSSCTLRADEQVFLDDISLDELRAQTGLSILPVPSDGEELLLALAGAGGIL